MLLLLLILQSFLTSQNANPNYDKKLADSLGADDYGMKSYYFVILKTGNTIIENKDSTKLIFRGHLDNINRLSNNGTLFIAGPLEKNEKNYRGLFFFDISNSEELVELLKSDPAISSGVLDYEYFKWYSSAALPTYLDNHRKIELKKP